jgi:hypothetical protein
LSLSLGRVTIKRIPITVEISREQRAILSTLPDCAKVMGVGDGRVVVRITDTHLAVVGPDLEGDWPNVRALIPTGRWGCEYESEGDQLITHLRPRE